MKKDQKDLSTRSTEDTNWARCPVCNVIWDKSFLLHGFWYIRWTLDYDSVPPAKLLEAPCPDHVEEIVVDGRRKGIKRTLYQDQLNEIKKSYMLCPVCRGWDLRWQDQAVPDQIGLCESVLTCSDCHALILLGGRFKDDGKDEDGELVHVFYREDLETKELNEAWPDIMRIIESPGVKIESICR